MNNKNQLEQLPDFVYVIVDAKWTNPNRITLILNKEFYNEHKKRVTMYPFKFNSRSYDYELTSHEGNMIVLKSSSIWGCLSEEDFIGGLLYYEPAVWSDRYFQNFLDNALWHHYDEVICKILKQYGIDEL